LKGGLKQPTKIDPAAYSLDSEELKGVEPPVLLKDQSKKSQKPKKRVTYKEDAQYMHTDESHPKHTPTKNKDSTNLNPSLNVSSNRSEDQP
jgi:hypothetical protein